MTKNIADRKVKLADLKEQFNLQYTDDESVFSEWQESLPPLNKIEQQTLDRVKRNYLYLLEYPVMESIVKMVVLSPLLDLAGFCTPPFRVDGETSIQVCAEDDGEIIQGSIDVLVLHNQLWVTVIEAKNSEFSITKAIPQTLAYMLATPKQTLPSFGLVLNGSEFLFLKVLRSKTAANEIYYSRSNLFSLLNQGNDLYRVLQVLKRLGQLAIAFST